MPVGDAMRDLIRSHAARVSEIATRRARAGIAAGEPPDDAIDPALPSGSCVLEDRRKA